MVIAVELRLLSLIVVRIAIGAIPGPSSSHPDIVLGRPVEIIGHHQIEPAVLIEVKPSRAGRPRALICNSSLRSDIRNRSSSVVAIENGATVAGHVEIRKSIIIEIPNSYALSVMPFAADSRF